MAVVNSDYQYTLELYRKDGTRLGQASVEVDWQTADEWVKLLALRRGLTPVAVARAVTSIEPIWHPKIGEPYVSGFRLSVTTSGRDPVVGDITTAYLQGLAQDATSRFVENGALPAGERVVYLAAAFPCVVESASETAMLFTAEDVAVPLPLPEARRAEVSATAVLIGEATEEDLPVFVPQAVLDEAARLSRQVEAQETGGILIGHVHRDPGLSDLFVRVTTQLPARHTEASATRLTFTSDTWTDVRAALALRRQGEIMLGWWHSHPVRHWCGECPAERQRVCRFGRDFFSEHDHALHHAVFGKAYSIALVVNDGVDDPTFSLFGWRRGRVEPRGFGIIDARAPAAGFKTTDRRLEDEPCSHPEPASSRLASSSSN